MSVQLSMVASFSLSTLTSLASSFPFWFKTNYSRQQTAVVPHCLLITWQSWYNYQPKFSVSEENSKWEPISSPPQTIFDMVRSSFADVRAASTEEGQDQVKSNCPPFSFCTSVLFAPSAAEVLLLHVFSPRV